MLSPCRFYYLKSIKLYKLDINYNKGYRSKYEFINCLSICYQTVFENQTNMNYCYIINIGYHYVHF